MSVLAILRPLPVAAITASRGAGVARLLTPSPRETWVDSAVGSLATIDIDLGAAVAIDTLFLGTTKATLATTWSVSSGVAGPTEVAWATPPALAVPASIATRPTHGLAMLAAAIPARYVRVVVNQPVGAPAMQAGVLAIGAALRPHWGHEWGGGRGISDLSTKTKLPDGGFGVGRGARRPTWQWTLDLTSAEREALYAIAFDLGESAPLLVIEDPDRTPGLAERIHWGLFDRLEAYERRSSGSTRWSFRIEDWV